MKCLISLNRERNLIFEIIVANDSSAYYYKAYQQIKNRFKIRLIRGKKRGVYANHNLLYKSAKGTHIRCIDDDHTLPTNHIRKTLAFIKSDKKAIWTIGEKYPLNPNSQNKIFYPGELTSAGFTDKVKNINDCVAIGGGSTIYPIEIFTKQNQFYIDTYKFGSTWLEFGPRLNMLGNKMRIMPNIFINHYYNEKRRSFNNSRLEQETRLFVIFFYNLVFKKNIKNFFLGLYYIIKYLLFEQGKKKIFILLSAYKNFIAIKKSGIWSIKTKSKF